MLSETFAELRSMVDEGMLTYPYSTRELVNVVKHLQQFPRDNITVVLENLFAFDAFDPDLRLQLYEVFQRHGKYTLMHCIHVHDMHLIRPTWVMDDARRDIVQSETTEKISFCAKLITHISPACFCRHPGFSRCVFLLTFRDHCGLQAFH